MMIGNVAVAVDVNDDVDDDGNGSKCCQAF